MKIERAGLIRVVWPILATVAPWPIPCALRAQVAAVDEGQEIAASRPTDAEISLDGILDEPAWASAAPATGFVQQRPDEGAPATQDTRAHVIIRDGAVIVGARLLDSSPDSIVARLARRDGSVHSDWFYVYLDSYHDGRTAFGFGVNAAGVKRDLRMFEDDRQDASWDGVWEAAVRTDGKSEVSEGSSCWLAVR